MDGKETKRSVSERSGAAQEVAEHAGGKIKLLSRETRGLVEDIKSWVELRMTLTQMDVENKVDARLNRAIVGVIVGALGFLGLTFALTAAALGLGTLFGHDAWGFLAVAGVLIFITLILLAVKPRIVDVSSGRGKSVKRDE